MSFRKKNPQKNQLNKIQIVIRNIFLLSRHLTNISLFKKCFVFDDDIFYLKLKTIMYTDHLTSSQSES